MSELTVQKRTRWKIGAFLAVAGFLYALIALSDELLPLFVAFGLAYAFGPLVDRLERRGVSRTWATVGILTVLVGLFALLIATLVPMVIGEMRDFIQNFPDFAATALKRVSTFARGYGIAIPGSVDALSERLRGSLQKGSMQSINPAVNAARHFLTSVAGVLVAFLNLLVIPIFFFYVCRDLPKARRYVFGLIPPRQQPYARTLYGRVDNVLSGYIRGQMVVATVLGVIFAVALVLLKVPFGLFIGILSGFLNMIPFVGQVTGLGLSILMAFVDFHGFGQIIGIACLFAVTNFLEGHFLSPKIVGDRVGLSPLWTIIALIVGGRLAGLLGMMMSVPLAGVFKILFGEVLIKYKCSSFYLDPPSRADRESREGARPAS